MSGNDPEIRVRIMMTEEEPGEDDNDIENATWCVDDDVVLASRALQYVICERIMTGRYLVIQSTETGVLHLSEVSAISTLGKTYHILFIN